MWLLPLRAFRAHSNANCDAKLVPIEVNQEPRTRRDFSSYSRALPGAEERGPVRRACSHWTRLALNVCERTCENNESGLLWEVVRAGCRRNSTVQYSVWKRGLGWEGQFESRRLE